jgi:hypothetical protein
MLIWSCGKNPGPADTSADGQSRKRALSSVAIAGKELKKQKHQGEQYMHEPTLKIKLLLTMLASQR